MKLDPQKSANDLEKGKKWLFRVPIPDWLVFPLSYMELFVLFAKTYGLAEAAGFSLGELLAIAFVATYLPRKRFFDVRQSVLMGDFFFSIPLILLYASVKGIPLLPLGVAITGYPVALSYVATAASLPVYAPILFIFFLPLFFVSGLGVTPYVAAIYVASIVMAKVTVHQINKSARSVLGIDGTALASSFFRAWFRKNDEEYESYLDQLSTKKRLSTDVLYFVGEDGTPLGTLVATDVHPGPFHEVGSSTLPYMISKAVEQTTGAPCLVLRGKGSHENDIPTREQALSFSQSVAASMPVFLTKSADDPPTAWKRAERIAFDQRKSGAFTLTSINTDAEKLVILSKAPYPCDDIPWEMGEDVEKLGCKLADAHNSGPVNGYSTLDYFSPRDVESIRSGVAKLGSLPKPDDVGPLWIGFSHIDSGQSLDTGICDGGAVAMAWRDSSDNKGVLVSFQGNNMITGLRDKVVDSLKALGFKHAEVTTTDNHQLSTSLQYVNRYSMVGVEDEDAVINMAVEAAKAAANAEKRSLVFVLKRIDELKVIGAESLEKIDKAIKSSMPVLGRWFLGSMAVTLAIALSCYLI